MTEINEALQQLFQTLLLAIISGVGVIAVACLNKFKTWALLKIQSLENQELRDSVEDAITQTANIVATVVMSIEQEEKQEVLKAMEDGQVTRDELLRLKDVAKQRVLNQLVPDTLELLSAHFGNVDEYISDLVSQQVLLIKNSMTR